MISGSITPNQSGGGGGGDATASNQTEQILQETITNQLIIDQNGYSVFKDSDSNSVLKNSIGSEGAGLSALKDTSGLSVVQDSVNDSVFNDQLKQSVFKDTRKQTLLKNAFGDIEIAKYSNTSLPDLVDIDLANYFSNTPDQSLISIQILFDNIATYNAIVVSKII